MITSAQLFIIIAAQIGLPLSSSTIFEYDGPLSSVFQFINSLPLVQTYNASKFHDQVALTDFAPVASLETSMEITFAQLKIIVTQLQATVKPKCPPTAPTGSKIVGKYCYYFSTTPSNWQLAEQDCNAKMGYLAEVLPANSPTFYTTIATAFSPQIVSIGPTGEFWLGISQPSSSIALNNLEYFSNHAVLQDTSIFLPTTLPPSLNINAVTLKSPGTKWNIYDTSNPLAMKSYICQFNTVV